MNHTKYSEVLNQSEQDLVIVVFSSSWSGGSQLLQYNLEDLREEGIPFKLSYFDVKEEILIAKQLNISKVPTSLFIFRREVKERLVGATPIHILRKKLQSLLSECDLL